MNSPHWIARFEKNRGAWQEPDWSAPCQMSLEDGREELARSFATFQLGETGGGTRLMRFVRREQERARKEGRPHEDSYERAFHLFLGEEHYHAEILARLVHYLGGTLIRRHWLNVIFRGVRSLLGLEFNLQVLLTAELIAEAYYGLLHRFAKDPVARAVCGKIAHDEVGHISFQVAFFRPHHIARSRAAAALWEWQFWTLLFFTERAVWLVHAPALKASDICRKRFRDGVFRAARSFVSRIRRDAPARLAHHLKSGTPGEQSPAA